MSTEKPTENTDADIDENETSASEPQKPPFSHVDLLLEGNTLFAQLTPNSSDTPTSKHLLQQMLSEQDYDQLLIQEDALKQIAEASQKAAPNKIAVGEKCSAQAELTLDGDKMQCHLNISRAWGGELISENSINELLEKHSVNKSQIDPDAIKAAIEQSHLNQDVEPTLIATGTPPEHGQDSLFDVLFEQPKPSNSAEQEDGTTNYFETHQYPAIHPGTELMRRSVPTEGSNGTDVQGKSLKAKPGKLIKFAKCEGAEISNSDENLLVATQKGHPVIGKQGVTISDTLELKNVDLTTGNIHFDGSVTILGNVCTQTRVEASGNVNIKGYVENATVIAGNDIVVGAGVISEQVGEDELEFTSTLKAGGDIQARFFNQTDARAGGNIIAAQYAMNCRLIATHKIILGDSGGKGVLLGGVAIAGEGATLNTLGSSAYVKTELHCASRKRLVHQLSALTKDEAVRQKELQQLQDFMVKIGEPEKLGKVLIDKTRKIKSAISALQERLEKLSIQRDSLQHLIEVSPQARVEINRNLFPNSTVSIGDLPFNSREELRKTTLKIKGKVIVHE